MKVVIDVWGGEFSQDHLARFIRGIPEALRIARRELAQDYLVNLRREVAWGTEEEFDLRRRTRKPPVADTLN